MRVAIIGESAYFKKFQKTVMSVRAVKRRCSGKGTKLSSGQAAKRQGGLSMYFLHQSGNVVLAYDLEKFLLITGYSPKGNSGFTYNEKWEFADPQEALESFSKAVSGEKRPIKKAAAACTNFIHRHSGSIYGVIGSAGIIFLILTAGASDSGSIGIGQAVLWGIGGLMLVLIGVYGSNHPYQQNGSQKNTRKARLRIGKFRL